MKKFTIDTKKPLLCHASIYIRTEYSSGIMWQGKDTEKTLVEELKENLSSSNFVYSGKDFIGREIFVDKDDVRKRVFCFPSEIDYVGSPEGLDSIIQKFKQGKFSTSHYLGTVGKEDVYDMTREELVETLKNNRKIIKSNMKEYIASHPGSDKFNVMDSVFESVRFLNTYDASYSKLWDTAEMTYGKVVDVFNTMVKNQELTMDNENKVYLVEKKRVLRPKTEKVKDDNQVNLFK